MNNCTQQIIPYGNDFDIRVTVTRYEDGEYVPFDLSSCSNLSVVLISNAEAPLEYTIDSDYPCIVTSHIEYNMVSPNVRYGIAVYGEDEDGNNFRWQMNPNEGFYVVSNTSATHVSHDVLTIDVAGRVGWGSSGVSRDELDAELSSVYNVISEEVTERQEAEGEINASAFGSISYGATQVNFVSLDGSESETLNAATTTSAGVMSALQVQLLINAAPNASVPNTYVQATNINGIKFQHDEDGTVTDLFNLYPATSTTAGVMSAAQAEKLDSINMSTKQDKIVYDLCATATQLSPAVNSMTVVQAEVDTLAITLPAVTVQDAPQSISIFFTTSASPNVTFSSADNKSILYYADYEIEASTSYEINALYNGVNWIIAYGKLN